MVKQVKESERTPLLSVLLEGASATGKSALAAKLCVESKFPLVRMVSPDAMIGDLVSHSFNNVIDGLFLWIRNA